MSFKVRAVVTIIVPRGENLFALIFIQLSMLTFPDRLVGAKFARKWFVNVFMLLIFLLNTS